MEEQTDTNRKNQFETNQSETLITIDQFLKILQKLKHK